MGICSVVLPKNALQNSPQKFFFPVIFLLRCCCCWTSSGRGSTWEKRGEKKKWTKKVAKKMRRAAFCHTFILFGGNKTTSSSNNVNNSSSSNSSDNNNFWWGADLAGPLVSSLPFPNFYLFILLKIELPKKGVAISSSSTATPPPCAKPMVPTSPSSRRRRNGGTSFTFWVGVVKVSSVFPARSGQTHFFHVLCFPPSALVPTSVNAGKTFMGLENLGGVNCGSTGQCTPHLTWADGTAFQGPTGWLDREVITTGSEICFRFRVRV